MTLNDEVRYAEKGEASAEGEAGLPASDDEYIWLPLLVGAQGSGRSCALVVPVLALRVDAVLCAERSVATDRKRVAVKLLKRRE